jgi:uncharacterized membrane protein
MSSSNERLFLKAIGMGVIAGMRSMSAPAIVSNYLAHNPSKSIAKTPFRAMGSSRTAGVLKALALGEMVADKLPMIPARIAPGPLVARGVSGALCGASVFAAEGERPAKGGLAGAVAAIASAYAFYHLRRRIGQESKVPDVALGFTEDAIVVGGGLCILGGGQNHSE